MNKNFAVLVSLGVICIGGSLLALRGVGSKQTFRTQPAVVKEPMVVTEPAIGQLAVAPRLQPTVSEGYISFMVNYNGQRFDYVLEETSNVKYLKAQLGRATNMNPAFIKLYFNKKQLKDGLKLKDIKGLSDHTIQMKTETAASAINKRAKKATKHMNY